METLLLGLIFAVGAACGSDLESTAILKAAETPVLTATATPAPLPTPTGSGPSGMSDSGTPAQTATPDPAGAGTRLPDLGNDHILPGAAHPDYNSVPATSGWHYALPFAPAPWGIYDMVLPDEVLVHNLEHAGIGIHYDCPEGCPDLVQRLSQLAAEYRKIVISPYPGMESRIALTAWTFIDHLDELDDGRVVAFIEAHINSAVAPEPLAP